MTMRNENGFPIPYRSGFSNEQDDSGGYAYAVFSRKDPDVERLVRENEQALVNDEWTERPFDLAYELTSWQSFSGQAGAAFASEPAARIYKHAVRVRQYRGYDI